MEFVYNIVVVTHLIGMAALVGGWIAFVSGAKATSVIVWGARAQLISGIVLVGMLEMGMTDGSPNHAKIGVKLLVAIAVAACAEIAAGKQRKGEAKPALLNAAGGLAILNVLVAALW